MFDQLYTLADGQCVYQGSTTQLVPFLGTLGLQCPSYHNPASYIIEVACGEYGDHTRKLVCAIDNGKNDIRDGKPFPELKLNDGFNNSDVFAKENMNTMMANKLAKGSTNNYDEKNINISSEQDLNNHGIKEFVADKSVEKPDVNSTILDSVVPVDQFTSKRANGSANIEKNVNVEREQPPSEVTKESAIDIEKPDVTSTLLESSIPVKQPRYGNTELQQFFIILSRALLFSRRDWVSFSLCQA